MCVLSFATSSKIGRIIMCHWPATNSLDSVHGVVGTRASTERPRVKQNNSRSRINGPNAIAQWRRRCGVVGAAPRAPLPGGDVIPCEAADEKRHKKQLTGPRDKIYPANF
jgi:hypothetical protein